MSRDDGRVLFWHSILTDGTGEVVAEHRETYFEVEIYDSSDIGDHVFEAPLLEVPC
jgi:hypothetical protein